VSPGSAASRTDIGIGATVTNAASGTPVSAVLTMQVLDAQGKVVSNAIAYDKTGTNLLGQFTLDPSQPWKDGKTVLPTEQVSSKVGIDATKKHSFPHLAVPPREHLERVDAQWERYGIRPVDGNAKKT